MAGLVTVGGCFFIPWMELRVSPCFRVLVWDVKRCPVSLRVVAFNVVGVCCGFEHKVHQLEMIP